MAEDIGLLDANQQDATLRRWNELVTNYQGARDGEPIFAQPASYNPNAGSIYRPQPGSTSQGTFSVMGGPGEGAGGIGPQVTNLRQLAEVSQVLTKSGLPPELRDMLFSRLTGIPFRSDRQVALESALSQIRQKHQLEAPMEEAEFGRRLEEQAERQASRGEQRDYREEIIAMRREAMQNQQVTQLKELHEISQKSLDPNIKAAVSQIVLRALGRLGGGVGGAPLSATPSEKSQAGITIRRIK